MNKGLIYLIQPAQLVGTERYKIGMSNKPNLERCNNGYSKGSRYLCIMECYNPSILEANIKKHFNNKFKLIAGNEYYEGNEEIILENFLNIKKEHDKNIKKKNINYNLDDHIEYFENNENPNFIYSENNNKDTIDYNFIITKPTWYESRGERFYTSYFSSSLDNIRNIFNNMFLFYKRNLIIPDEEKYNKEFYNKKIIKLIINIEEYFDIEIIKIKNVDKYTAEFLNNYKKEIINIINLKYYDDNNRIIDCRETEDNIIERINHYENGKIVLYTSKCGSTTLLDGELYSFINFLGKYHNDFEFLSVKHIHIKNDCPYELIKESKSIYSGIIILNGCFAFLSNKGIIYNDYYYNNNCQCNASGEIQESLEGFIYNLYHEEELHLFNNTKYDQINFRKIVYPLIIKYSIKETFSENFNNILINNKNYFTKSGVKGI